MKKIDQIKGKTCPVEGSFNDLSVFDFPGVYIISDKKGNIVYIGSAYARHIKVRLAQYLINSKTGNTLANKICKVDDKKIKNVEDIKKEQRLAAIEKIKEFKILAIPHKDLEYQLIKDCKPMYNSNGTK